MLRLLDGAMLARRKARGHPALAPLPHNVVQTPDGRVRTVRSMLVARYRGAFAC
jgi:hypothetical protein